MSRSFRLGLFLVGAMLVLAGGIFLIGNKNFLFTRTYHLRAEFHNVAGLGSGAAVRVGGIYQGTVTSIQLPTHPGGNVIVGMEVSRGTRNIIKKDSVASIKTEGLLGNKYVEISFGTSEAERVKDGDTIGSEPPLDFSDLFRKANDILDTTTSAMQRVDQASGELRSISAKINRGEGTVGALINDRAVYRQVQETAAEAAKGAMAFQENMEALKHNFFLRGFFRRRGYQDASELGKHAIPQLPREPYAKRFVYEAGEIFEKPDTARLRDRKALNSAGKFLEQHRYGLAVVTASTDRRGDEEKNRVLSAARAMVVRDYLAETFQLEDGRVKTLALGEAQDSGEAGKVAVLIYPERPEPSGRRRNGSPTPAAP